MEDLANKPRPPALAWRGGEVLMQNENIRFLPWSYLTKKTGETAFELGAALPPLCGPTVNVSKQEKNCVFLPKTNKRGYIGPKVLKIKQKGLTMDQKWQTMLGIN